MKPQTQPQFNRARLEILNYIIAFCTQEHFESGERYGIFDLGHSFKSGILTDINIQIGSLVKLKSAPFSKWYLSWLIEIKDNGYEREYLLKSIDDNSLCWWSNVSIAALPLETSDKFPSWKWNDEQFEFNDRWVRKACKDCYMFRPLYAEFGEDNNVTLGIREMFSNETVNSITFQNYKKVTVKQMRDFYLETTLIKKTQNI